MNKQTFWGPTMAGAMKQAAEELGVNAMILSTDEGIHPDPPFTKIYSVTATPGEEFPREFLEPESSFYGRNAQRGRKAEALMPSPESMSAEETRAQTVLLSGLMNQLQTLQSELIDLRSAREQWQKTAELCQDLRREVQFLSQSVEGIRRLEHVSNERRFQRGQGGRGSLLETQELESREPLRVTSPSWQVETSTLYVVQGPSGSGKTLTAAKMAAEANQCGKSVALIDCSGLGELEKLGNLSGIPTWNVPTEGSLELVLRACAGLDLIILDTSGAELVDITNQLNGFDCPMEVHFLSVLPATWDEGSLESSVLETSQIDSIAVTKLDEAKSINGVLAVARNSGYPVSHVCTGKNYPGDIREANSEELIAKTRAA